MNKISKKLLIISFWAIRILTTILLLMAIWNVIKNEPVIINPIIYLIYVAFFVYLTWVTKISFPEDE